MQPWVERRTAQGHHVAFISNRPSADAIRTQIRELARGGDLRFVVLVGDADPAMEQNEALRDRSLPTHFSQATVNVRWAASRS